MKEFQDMTKKDPIKVRLTNGILLSLGEGTNVQFGTEGLNVSQKKKSEKDTKMIQ